MTENKERKTSSSMFKLSDEAKKVIASFDKKQVAKEIKKKKRLYEKCSL